MTKRAICRHFLLDLSFLVIHTHAGPQLREGNNMDDVKDLVKYFSDVMSYDVRMIRFTSGDQ